MYSCCFNIQGLEGDFKIQINLKILINVACKPEDPDQ